jgi:nucleoside triphosphate pyrophosphatase
MAEAGYTFDVEPSDAPEDLPPESDAPAGEAEHLAQAKAEAVAARSNVRGRWVIGADTIVVLGRRIIGKPADDEDAVRILLTLSGTRHQVTTGLALVQVGTGRRIVRSATTDIWMHVIDEAEVRRYVATGGSDGKAGAYAVQEGADRYIDRTDGSFTNIIGLPMELLAAMLAEVGYRGPAT